MTEKNRDSGIPVGTFLADDFQGFRRRFSGSHRLFVKFYQAMKMSRNKSLKSYKKDLKVARSCSLFSESRRRFSGRNLRIPADLGFFSFTDPPPQKKDGYFDWQVPVDHWADIY